MANTFIEGENYGRIYTIADLQRSGPSLIWVILCEFNGVQLNQTIAISFILGY